MVQLTVALPPAVPSRRLQVLQPDPLPRPAVRAGSAAPRRAGGGERRPRADRIPQRPLPAAAAAADRRERIR